MRICTKLIDELRTINNGLKCDKCKSAQKQLEETKTTLEEKDQVIETLRNYVQSKLPSISLNVPMIARILICLRSLLLILIGTFYKMQKRTSFLCHSNYKKYWTNLLLGDVSPIGQRMKLQQKKNMIIDMPIQTLAAPMG